MGEEAAAAVLKVKHEISLPKLTQAIATLFGSHVSYAPEVSLSYGPYLVFSTPKGKTTADPFKKECLPHKHTIEQLGSQKCSRFFVFCLITLPLKPLFPPHLCAFHWRLRKNLVGGSQTFSSGP